MFPQPGCCRRRTAEALDRVFRLLLLACGVSYYKAFAPERLRCAAFPLDPATAGFFTDFYEKGLGEFAWRNGIDLAARLHIVTDDRSSRRRRCRLELPRRTCVPVGGGKDLHRHHRVPEAGRRTAGAVLTGQRRSRSRRRSRGRAAVRSGSRAGSIRRCSRSTTAGALNGHVPITGILSMIVLACAIIHGFDAIAMSNEHSASAPNLRRR